MSAWLVSETHIRALVTAMTEATGRCARFPFPPAAILDRHPALFRNLIEARDKGEKLPIYNDPQAIGAALWLANVLALRARYPADYGAEAEADALAYRHCDVTIPPASLIKQAQCYAYQCAEDNEAAYEWSQAIKAELVSWAIDRLPDYVVAPWGLD